MRYLIDKELYPVEEKTACEEYTIVTEKFVTSYVTVLI